MLVLWEGRCARGQIEDNGRQTCRWRAAGKDSRKRMLSANIPCGCGTCSGTMSSLQVCLARRLAGHCFHYGNYVNSYVNCKEICKNQQCAKECKDLPLETSLRLLSSLYGCWINYFKPSPCLSPLPCISLNFPIFPISLKFRPKLKFHLVATHPYANGGSGDLF